MNVMVLFGSKSDAYIYDPLKAQLLDLGCNVDFRFLSVHRSPELLDRELAGAEPDFIVAGAGLSAHLPGVVSSKALTPVIGIPCAPAFGGIDALLSMIQMPFGIPVLTAAPDSVQAVVEFLRDFTRLDLRFAEQPVQVVVERNKAALPYAEALLAKARNLADKAGLGISVRHDLAPEAVNVVCVEIDAQAPDAPIPFARARGEICVYVPVFKDAAYKDPLSAIHLLKRMKSAGGLWVGANNIGNGFLAGLQLANQNGAWSAVLTNAKKGYMHLYG